MSAGEPGGERPYNGADGRFKAGNPGRRQGAKGLLGQEFFEHLYADFQQNGPAVIAEVRKNRPTEYLRVVASCVPKELTVTSEVSNFAHLSDAELDAEIRKMVDEINATDEAKRQMPVKSGGRGGVK